MGWTGEKMEGKFYTTSRKIRYVFGLVFGLAVIGVAIYWKQNGMFGDKLLWFIVSAVCGFALSAVMICLLVGLRRTLYADDSGLKYNDILYGYENIINVFPMSAGRDGALLVTLVSGKTVNISCLENCTEIADFVRLRLPEREYDIEKTREEVKNGEKMSRFYMCLLIAIFILMTAILVLLIIQFYRNTDGGSNRRIIIFAIDEFVLAIALFIVSRRSSKEYADLNGKKQYLRKEKMKDTQVRDGAKKILCDPDYHIRIVIFDDDGWYAVAEMLNENDEMIVLDTSEHFKTEKELCEAIRADGLIEIKSER